MRHALALAAVLCTPLLSACEIKREGDAAPGPSSPATAASAPASNSAAAPAAFDPATVPESTAALPEFPLFKPLEGLENDWDAKDANRAFDRDYFIAGTQLIPVEGKVYRAQFGLTRARPYSSLEFRHNYELAITELGGRKIGGTVSTNPFRAKLEGTTPAPTGHCFIDPCDEADFYLLRQGGKEWWILVATGSFPLHGYVTVLEKQDMAKSYSFLDAAALKSALDAKGRVPVYIEFDLNRATLRPAALPAIDEITKLLQANPALRVSIEGHTDDTGNPARNQPLSLARAEAVRAELLAAGIAAGRLKTAGFGSTRPLAQGTSEDARARNRRVELVKF
ncbi:MAG: OmpA family protein [Novosphingobium sp.]|nr:OmpA family protein [Novosphingobium sp.]